jgi:hypothetical protein
VAYDTVRHDHRITLRRPGQPAAPTVVTGGENILRLFRNGSPVLAKRHESRSRAGRSNGRWAVSQIVGSLAGDSFPPATEGHIRASCDALPIGSLPRRDCLCALLTAHRRRWTARAWYQDRDCRKSPIGIVNSRRADSRSPKWPHCRAEVS